MNSTMMSPFKLAPWCVMSALMIAGCAAPPAPAPSPANSSATSATAGSTTTTATQTAATTPAAAPTGKKSAKQVPVPPESTTPVTLEHRAEPLPAGVKLAMADGDLATDIEVGKPGGQFVFCAFGEGPKTFNPITANDSASNDCISLMQASLLTYDAKLQEYKPGLLKEWYPDAQDATSWTLKLREGLQWSDGHALTAADVVFGAQLIFDERLLCAARDVMKVNDKAPVFTEVNATTVHLKLPAPSASLPVILGFTPVAKHAYEAAYKKGPDAFTAAFSVDQPADKIVCCGPFRLKQVVPGQRVILEKNPNYFRFDKNGTRLPYLDTFVIAYSADNDQMALAFKKDGDAMERPRPDALPSLIDGQEAGGWTVYDVGPANASDLFWFNLKPMDSKTSEPYVAPEKQKIFRDRRFREAVLRAIDREVIIKSEMRGLAVVSHGMTSPAHRGWVNTNLPHYDFEPETAKNLLEEVGLKDKDGDGVRELDGKKFTFTIITNKGNKLRENVALLLASQLRKVGLDAKVDLVEFNALLTMTDQTYKYEACLLGLTGTLSHPAGTMNTWPSSSRTNLYAPRQEKPGFPEEEKIDQLVRDFSSTPDPNTQRTVFKEIQRLHAEQLFVLPLWTRRAYYAGRDRIGNFKPTPAADLIWNADEYYVKN